MTTSKKLSTKVSDTLPDFQFLLCKITFGAGTVPVQASHDLAGIGAVPAPTVKLMMINKGKGSVAV